MADEKTYTEDEHIGILTERVRRETADLTAQVDQLTGNVNELSSKLDVAESAKVAAEQKALEAEKALEDFQNQVTEREAAAERKDTRVAKIREVASHLPDEWFDADGRLDRIIAMDDGTFEGYVADLGSTNSVAPVGTSIPRETAMAGQQPPSATGVSGTTARAHLLRRYEKTEV